MLTNIWLRSYLLLAFVGGAISVFLVDSSIVGAAYALAILIPAAIVGTTRGLVVPTPFVVGMLVLTLIASLSTMLNANEALLLIAAFKVIAIPLIAYVVGTNLLSVDKIASATPLLSVLSVATLGACVWQVNQGAESLIEAGYQAGRDVRTFDGDVRAFGFFPRDNIAAQVASVVVIIALWACIRYPRYRYWAAIALVSCLGILLLSRNRTALLATIAAVLVVMWRELRSRVNLRYYLVGVILAGLAIGVQLSLLGTANSLFERFRLWTSVVVASNPYYGDGPGSAGVTAMTTLAGGGTISNPGDNYFVTAGAQFGAIGVGLVVALIYWLFTRSLLLDLRDSCAATLSIALTVFFGLSLITNNTFEEIPTAPLIFLFMGGLHSALMLGGQSASRRGRTVEVPAASKFGIRFLQPLTSDFPRMG
ncbi:hypothetical protein [Gordonia sp. (in: high G+C Gram-positive bacteria)]|uniref:O-antigen ligase family protein n=1 Tax=Gordonia sp. (in: high G+C Gram-positive bacteria) TaxID=84139 RepID=UPI00257C1DBD|nr:hypothetical protein [Gordonia sp. (in: high G+C Gram-positive bacteria)]